MFWSGNFIFVRELNSLLKEENVTLKQVLEADDILQECKADNKALIQFLTKPEVLAELITLITVEPPKDVELTAQYRHASVACEVLTSHLSMLSDRLSLDTTQMNRLCDFINKEPPLNPLLASYFSKTIEMLLERSPKQDWYLHHIVCLRVLDFLRGRRDFLPNLLRHAHTSAVCDALKCFMRVDDLFNKIVMEWIEEHQLLESLIQIVCGTYAPPPIVPSDTTAPAPAAPAAPAEPCAVQAVKEIIEQVKQIQINHAEDGGGAPENCDKEPAQSDPPTATEPTDGSKEPPTEVSAASEGTPPEARSYATVTRRQPKAASETSDVPKEPEQNLEGERQPESPEAAERRARVAAANVAALLCELITTGCCLDVCGAATRSLTSWVLVSRLQSERLVQLLLSSMFSSGSNAALQHGATVLHALLTAPQVHRHPALNDAGGTAGGSNATEGAVEERSCVELAIAPHLPLLHNALRRDPDAPSEHGHSQGDGASSPGRVGAARVQIAALLAHLALSDVEEVPNTMVTLGTPGLLIELFFRYPHNTFLHAEVHSFVKHALSNQPFRLQYANHLINECDLLTRLMDVFEENEAKKETNGTRTAYMGHVVLMLRKLARALDPGCELLDQLQLPSELVQRWQTFLTTSLEPLSQHLDTPLGGYYPPENIYEVENMADNMEATYEFNELPADELARCDMPPHDAPEGGEAYARDTLEDDDDDEKMENAKRSFLDLARQRFDDNTWEDSPGGDEGEEGLPEGVFGARGVHHVLDDVSPWESAPSSAFEASELANAFVAADAGWAQFSQVCVPPVDPFAPVSATQDTATSSGETRQPPVALFDENFDDPMKLRLEPADTSTDASAELANNLLTAMSAMAPDVIANIVNANLAPPPGSDANLPPPPGCDASLPPPPGCDANLPPPSGSDANLPPPPGSDANLPPLPGPGAPGAEDS